MESTNNSKANDKRVSLSEVVVSQNDPIIARVALKLGNQVEWGECSGEKKIELTVIGQATLEALNKILPRPLEARLDYVEAVAAQRENTPQTALSLIRFREAQKEIFLNGSCPIGDSPHQAAAKSILDALNRKIDVELQRAAFRARTGALVATNDMIAVINPEPSTQPAIESIENVNKVVPDKETTIVEDALNIERAANLSAQAYSNSIKGNYEQAAFYYQQAIELESSNARYYYELGLVLSKLPDKIQEARIALKQAVELNPNEATYTKELDYFDRGEQLAAPEIIKDFSGRSITIIEEEQPKTLMQTRVSNKVVAAIVFVILVLAGTPIILFFINSEFGNNIDKTIEAEQPQELKLVYEWPSVESGKNIKQKADEIIKQEGVAEVSNAFWSVSIDKTGKINASFSYMGKDQKVREATWNVDLAKKYVLPINPGAEAISGKVK